VGWAGGPRSFPKSHQSATEHLDLGPEISAVHAAADRVLSLGQLDASTTTHRVGNAELIRVAGVLQAAAAQLLSLQAQLNAAS
jgi:hypothetical protein